MPPIPLLRNTRLPRNGVVGDAGSDLSPRGARGGVDITNVGGASRTGSERTWLKSSVVRGLRKRDIGHQEREE
jgi:hypothetical protein